jgi:hypothetical protein
LIVCSIVCLNDLKIAAGDRVGAHGDASWTYCRIHVGELWNEDFSFKSVKVSRVRCSIVFSAWLSARRRATYSNPNRNTYLGCVLGSKSPRARLLTV